HVDDRCSRLDHVRPDDTGHAGRCHDDVCLDHMARQVASSSVAQRDGGVLTSPGQQQAKRPPNGQATPDDNDVGTCDGDAIAAQQFDDAHWGARQWRCLPEHQAPEVVWVKPVDILARVYPGQESELVEPGRLLHEVSGTGRVRVELVDNCLDLTLAYVRAEVVPDARDADLGAVLVLGIDVPPGAWVLANPHGPETGDDAAFCQRRDASLELVLDRCEGRPAIQDLRGHVLNPSTGGAAQPWWSPSRDELRGCGQLDRQSGLGQAEGCRSRPAQKAAHVIVGCPCRVDHRHGHRCRRLPGYALARWRASRTTTPAASADSGHGTPTLPAQWAKCRVLVKYIVIPAAVAASMTSGSRTDPPGATTARTPASNSTWSPSAKGMNASDAATEPAARSTPALVTASWQESTRLTWPIPTPTLAPPLTSRMALDLTARTARQANRRSASVAVPAGSPHTSCQREGSSPPVSPSTTASILSRVCIKTPPLTGRKSTSSPRSMPSGSFRRRIAFLRLRISSASGSKAGATTTSVNTVATCSAIAAVTGRLVATTPPNADWGSHAWASRYAWAMSAPTAIPQGLACLMMATAGSAWS